MRRRRFQRRSQGEQFTHAMARQGREWRKGKLVSFPGEESDKTLPHCQVRTKHSEEKKRKKKEALAERETYWWELQIAQGKNNGNFKWHFHGAVISWQMFTNGAICQKTVVYKMQTGRRAADQFVMSTEAVIPNPSGFRRARKNYLKLLCSMWWWPF